MWLQRFAVGNCMATLPPPYETVLPKAILGHTEFFNREIKAMATSESWRVVCQDPGDGSGDVIVELPPALLEKLGWAVGDDLVIEGDKEGISLKLKPRSADAAS
ncbi:AbrB/MazE/SpoVT family DNA-binding domain-containing protein [Pseudomonas sp. SP16.1]|uniref:AbrB/MazE/SpoVT family DNA-binding domain-containing protein n=2 Tax=Pseudomonas TaxID=286 RepID=UPI0040461B26